MKTIRIGRKSIEFILPGPPKQKVYWVGDYNHWQTSRAIRYSPKLGGYKYRIYAKQDGIYFYKWVVNGHWMLDPYNHRRFDNGPFGTNSYVAMPKYRTPFEIYAHPDTPAGQITRHQIFSEAMRTQREVFVYLPAGYDPRNNYPLLVLQDGAECVSLLPAQTVFDNLIHQRYTRPFIACMVTPYHRDRDYIFNAKFEKFLGHDLPLWAQRNFAISPLRQERAIFGYSLGGLVSLRTCLHYPEIYGLAGGESSAFWPKNLQIYQEVAHRPPKGSRIYLGCGDMDGGTRLSQFMSSLLQQSGVECQLKISVGAHDWYYWKSHMRYSLQYFFPPR